MLLALKAVLSFNYKMSDIKLKPELLKEINDRAMRDIPEWLCIKLMDKLSDGKGFRDRASFVEYMSRVFANEMRFDSNKKIESRLKIYDEYDFISTGNLDKAESVLAEKDDVTGVRRDGVNLLFTASQNGFSDIAKILIEKGCDVNLRYEYGYNALFAAVSSNNLEVVKLLVESGADINSKLDDGSEVLMNGLIKGLNNVEIIDYLISKGCDINNRNKYGNTSLSNAVKYSNVEVIRHLISCGAKFGRWLCMRVFNCCD